DRSGAAPRRAEPPTGTGSRCRPARVPRSPPPRHRPAAAGRDRRRHPRRARVRRPTGGRRLTRDAPPFRYVPPGFGRAVPRRPRPAAARRSGRPSSEHVRGTQEAAERTDREDQPVEVVVEVEVAREAGTGEQLLVPATVGALG